MANLKKLKVFQWWLRILKWYWSSIEAFFFRKYLSLLINFNIYFFKRKFCLSGVLRLLANLNLNKTRNLETYKIHLKIFYWKTCQVFIILIAWNVSIPILLLFPFKKLIICYYKKSKKIWIKYWNFRSLWYIIISKTQIPAFKVYYLDFFIVII